MRLAIHKERILRRMGGSYPLTEANVPSPFRTVHEAESAIRKIISDAGSKAYARRCARRQLQQLGRPFGGKHLMQLSGVQLQELCIELEIELRHRQYEKWLAEDPGFRKYVQEKRNAC